MGPQLDVIEIKSSLEPDFAVAHYVNGADFMAADHRDQIGCLVVEESSSGRSAIELLEYAKSAADRLTVVVMADPEQVRLAVHAFRAGAHEVLQKPVAANHVVAAVHSAMAALASRPEFQQILERLAAVEAVAALTDRQRDILQRIIQGQASKAIAADMKVSQRTIDNHRAAIMKRLGASSVPSLIKKAMMVEDRGHREGVDGRRHHQLAGTDPG